MNQEEVVSAKTLRAVLLYDGVPEGRVKAMSDEEVRLAAHEVCAKPNVALERIAARMADDAALKQHQSRPDYASALGVLMEIRAQKYL